MVTGLYLLCIQHFNDFDKMGSKVTQRSLEVNLYKPHLSLWLVVLVTKYGIKLD